MDTASTAQFVLDRCMYVERLHLRNRRRSQHSCRPPPAPLTIVLCRAPTFTLDTELLHTPPHACLVAAAERLSANLFCNFSRWATVVHRTVPPRTIVQAAQCLGPLRWPAKPLALTCDTTQTHAFAFGKHLRLNTEKLLSIELQDLRWLAHATNAWRSCAGSTHAPQTNRDLFVLNDVFQRAHKAMLATTILGVAWCHRNWRACCSMRVNNMAQASVGRHAV